MKLIYTATNKEAAIGDIVKIPDRDGFYKLVNATIPNGYNRHLGRVYVRPLDRPHDEAVEYMPYVIGAEWIDC